MRPMTIDAVEALLRDRLSQPLPGPPAQRRFSPQPMREQWAPDLRPEEARHAAVLLLVYPGTEGPTLPLTVRHSALAHHGGQISLPGGALDPGESAEAAALREAEEEIGVPSADIRILGPLSPLWVFVSNFVVHPFVGVTPTRPLFRPDPGEVETLVEVPMAAVRSASRIKWGLLDRAGTPVDYPYFDLSGGQHVWGATAMILGEFSCLFEPDFGPSSVSREP